MKTIANLVGFFLYIFISLSYATTEKEMQQWSYQNFNEKNEKKEVIKLITHRSSDWPIIQPSTAISAEFSWFKDRFNIYLWRSTNNIWVRIEPIEKSEPFVCGGAFDIFQNGIFRLGGEGKSIVKIEKSNGHSKCGEITESAVYKLVLWSMVSDRADLTQPFELFFNRKNDPENRKFSLSLGVNTPADNLNKSNQLFDFAERTYPQFFNPSGMETFSIDEYWVRYYSNTDTYIGTLGESIYVYGVIFNGLQYVGKINNFIDGNASANNASQTLGKCTDAFPKPACNSINAGAGVNSSFVSGGSCSGSFPEYEYDPSLSEGSEQVCGLGVIDCGACATDY